MSDPRYDKLAKLLVEYSCALKKGESVFIDVADIPDRMTIALVRAARKVGANPIVETRQSRVVRELVKGTTDSHAKLTRDVELQRMKKVQAYIAIRGAENTSELSDVPPKVMQAYSKTMRPVLNYRVNKTRWVVLRWPTPSMAQAANMSTEAFEDFYFDVCTFDYRRVVGYARSKCVRYDTAGALGCRPALGLRLLGSHCRVGLGPMLVGKFQLTILEHAQSLCWDDNVPSAPA